MSKKSDPKNFVLEKNFVKEIFGLKNFWLKKKIGTVKMLFPEHILGKKKNIMGQKNLGSRKIWGLKKKFWV